MQRYLAPAALAFWIVGCSNPAADKPQATVSEAKEIAPASTTEPSAEGGEAVAAAERVVFNGEGSQIGFVGSKIVGGSHDGGFKSFVGSFTLDPSTGVVTAVEATIDMNSTWSDNEKLTAHLKNKDFFEVKTYPEAKFVSFEIKATEDSGATHEVTGNFTLHGVTKSITFPATIETSAEGVTLSSEFVLKRGDFNIVYGNVGDNAIRDAVVIKLALKGMRSPSASAEARPAG